MRPTMLIRRKLALTTSAVALALPLSSCGFDYATDRPYTPAAGANERDAEVDVLGAAIVASRDGAGTFIGGLANNSATDVITFTGLSGENGEQVSAEVEPRPIDPLGFENLSEEDNGFAVTGDFAAGDYLAVRLSFDNGESVQIDVPVVTNCGIFEGFDFASDDGDGGGTYDCEPLESVRDYGPGEEGLEGDELEPEGGAESEPENTQ
ncbi:hypothetical protein BKA08_001916 [Nocardioides marinisabuli]|uniref:Lipoprotein n=1 Tax=Nocardioides marinisabuli TaxID=419476 RepID=A0A7Y9F1B2_9ACTN|nr:hypothetical protein [Nocardioides marinisabuli]NYD57678.1 hypothetical protein [Nocardioides marinisabuli]